MLCSPPCSASVAACSPSGACSAETGETGEGECSCAAVGKAVTRKAPIARAKNTLRFNSQAVRNVVCTAVPCLLLGGAAEDAVDDGAGQIVGIAVERLAC